MLLYIIDNYKAYQYAMHIYCRKNIFIIRQHTNTKTKSISYMCMQATAVLVPSTGVLRDVHMTLAWWKPYDGIHSKTHMWLRPQAL